MERQPLVGQDLLIIKASRSHSDTPHSVRLLWTGDQPEADTHIWQHTTLTTDRHPCPGGIRTRNRSKREAADPFLRPRGHWDRQNWIYSVQTLTARNINAKLLDNYGHQVCEVTNIRKCVPNISVKWFPQWTLRINAYTTVGTLIVATIYLQLIQNKYMFRSFTVLQCSHQHCVQPVASDMEVVGYL